MARALFIFSAEIILLMTPIIFPAIPLEIAMFIYGFAIALLCLAFYLYWSPSRRLGFSEKSKICSAIKKIDIKTPKIGVIPAANTEECADYAEDIIEAIKMSGIESYFETYMFGGRPTSRGVSLHVNGKANSWIYGLSAALKSGGVENKIVENNSNNEESSLMFINVGRP